MFCCMNKDHLLFWFNQRENVKINLKNVFFKFTNDVTDGNWGTIHQGLDNPGGMYLDNNPNTHRAADRVKRNIKFDTFDLRTLDPGIHGVSAPNN